LPQDFKALNTPQSTNIVAHPHCHVHRESLFQYRPLLMRDAPSRASVLRPRASTFPTPGAEHQPELLCFDLTGHSANVISRIAFATFFAILNQNKSVSGECQFQSSIKPRSDVFGTRSPPSISLRFSLGNVSHTPWPWLYST
jgi:hypothetical protein